MLLTVRFAVLLLLIGLSVAPLSAQRAELAQARTLYNERQFDAAIEAAAIAQKTPATQDAATVVLARAHLERYRAQANPDDLSAARIALGTVRVSNLDSRDDVDFLMALGEALFSKTTTVPQPPSLRAGSMAPSQRVRRPAKRWSTGGAAPWSGTLICSSATREWRCFAGCATGCRVSCREAPAPLLPPTGLWSLPAARGNPPKLGTLRLPAGSGPGWPGHDRRRCALTSTNWSLKASFPIGSTRCPPTDAPRLNPIFAANGQ